MVDSINTGINVNTFRIKSISNFDLTNLINGSILQYNSTTNMWVPISKLPIEFGGTNSTTTSTARTALGVPPTSHATSATTYGISSATNYGHAMASSTTPLVAGTATLGVETAKFARGDHVHPVQTSVSGNAGTATVLETPRTISISEGATGTATSFDGSANISIPITALDATKLTGLVPITSIPPASIERMVIVTDDTARYALTTDTVQNGDTVKVTSSGYMYFVIDEGNLDSDAGYAIYTAGSIDAGQIISGTIDAARLPVTAAGLAFVPLVTVSETAPSTPTEGDAYYKPSTQKIHTYTGGSWDAGVTPTSGVVYQALDTLKTLQFYVIEPDLTNYIDLAGVVHSAGDDFETISLPVLTLPPGYYIIGFVSAYASIATELTFGKIVFTNSTSTGVTTQLLTTTPTSYAVPVGCNGITLMVRTYYDGTPTAVAHTYAGFK